MKRKRVLASWIILAASFLCMFAATAYVLFYYIEQKQYEGTIENLREMVYLPGAEAAGVPEGEGKKKTGRSAKAVIDFKLLSEINQDICAWLNIPDTEIDYPVLYHEGDAEFYLHRDLYRKNSVYGSLFFAEGCIPVQKDVSLLVYGHHMKDGSMFAGLMEFKQKKYYEKHPYLYLYTPECYYRYQIAAVVLTDISKENPDAFYCDNYIDLSDPGTFEDMARKIAQKELYQTDVTMEAGDQILMLSTCEYSSENGRLVVIAKQDTREVYGDAADERER